MTIQRTMLAATFLLAGACAPMGPAAEPRSSAAMDAAVAAKAPSRTLQALDVRAFDLLVSRNISPLVSCHPGTSGVCPLWIDVQMNGKECIVKVDDIHVPAGVRILWQVRGGAWRFTSNGVEFKDANAGSAFTGHSTGGGQAYSWDVLPNAPHGYYAYAIHLTSDAGSCDVDPGVWI